MLKNPVSKIFIVIAVLAAAFVTISFVSPAEPTPDSLRLPARPVFLVYPGTAHLSDFYERHSDWRPQVAPANIPVTGTSHLSDFYQRYQARSMSEAVADTYDYILRHPELRLKNTAVDTSDYFLRHRK